MSCNISTVAGVVIAGGKGSRMCYSDKPLLEIGGKSIIERIVDTAGGQVGSLIINVNSNSEGYTRFNLPIVRDDRDFVGPLAGILAALNYVATNLPEVRAVACFPGDVPWFPEDIVDGMLDAMHESASEVAWLRTDGQIQPLFSVWSLPLRQALEEALKKGMYSPMQFILSRKNTVVEYPDPSPGFFSNINTPEDLDAARRMVQQDDSLDKPHG